VNVTLDPKSSIPSYQVKDGLPRRSSASARPAA
jgi:hypothetical protein